MSRYRNFALFMLLAAVWGSSFTAIKVGLEFFPPVLFAAIRYDVAGVLMLGYAVYATDRWRPAGRGEWTLVGIGSALMIAGYHAFLFIGEQDPAVTSAAAAVIISLNPVLTTGFARGLLPAERLSVLGIAGLLLGLGGVAVLANPDPGNLLAGGLIAKGFVLAAAVSFALGSVLTRRVDASLPIKTMEAWSMLGGALLLHAISLGIGETPVGIRWTPAALAALLYLSTAASAVGFLIYFDLLDRLGPIEINLVSYVAPLWAALAGLALRSVLPDAPTAIGFVLIFAGFLLIKRDAIREEIPHLRRQIGGPFS